MVLNWFVILALAPILRNSLPFRQRLLLTAPATATATPAAALVRGQQQQEIVRELQDVCVVSH